MTNTAGLIVEGLCELRIKWALYCLTQPVVAGVDVVIVDVGYSAPKRDGIYRKQVAGNDNSVTGLPIIHMHYVAYMSCF